MNGGGSPSSRKPRAANPHMPMTSESKHERRGSLSLSRGNNSLRVSSYEPHMILFLNLNLQLFQGNKEVTEDELR